MQRVDCRGIQRNSNEDEHMGECMNNKQYCVAYKFIFLMSSVETIIFSGLTATKKVIFSHREFLQLLLLVIDKNVFEFNVEIYRK